MIPLAKDWTKPALFFSEIGYWKKTIYKKKYAGFMASP
jgi:hypothetical protein